MAGHVGVRMIRNNAFSFPLFRIICRKYHEGEKTCSSSCVLDIFLQKLCFLCTSGNIQEAIEAISSDDCSSPMLSDILHCLTLSDKLVLWFCCVYLIIYKKLPDAIVHRFEYEKELLEIDWPYAHLSTDEKSRAIKMMDEAINTSQLLEIDIKDANIEVAQQFAVSHVKCMEAIGCNDISRDWLDTYSSKFPSCVELSLLVSKTKANSNGDRSFGNESFEEALSNLPKGACQQTLKIMARSQISSAAVTKSSISSLEGSHANLSQRDSMFSYLNFALMKMLVGDPEDSLAAIDKAFRVAPASHMKQFFEALANILQFSKSSTKEALIYEQLSILKRYLDETWSLSSPEPLSWQFLRNIKKTAAQQLLSAVLCPISPDQRLLNAALEVLHGPFLVPEWLAHRDLVKYVETVMDVLPSDYRFAISVCRFVRRTHGVKEGSSSSVLYWAISLMVNALFSAIPAAAEHVWVEAAAFVEHVVTADDIGGRFYRRALAVHPFSLNLWQSFYRFGEMLGDADSALLAAKHVGVTLP